MPLPSVWAFVACATTMPAADFCVAVRVNRFTLSHDSVTRRRPPEVSSTAFSAQPPDLPPADLMDVGFAVFCPLARCCRPHHPVFVHRLAPLLHASFRPRLATTPLRFAMTSPPSGCQRDFHPQAVEHARHTKSAAGLKGLPPVLFTSILQIHPGPYGLATLFRNHYKFKCLQAHITSGRDSASNVTDVPLLWLTGQPTA